MFHTKKYATYKNRNKGKHNFTYMVMMTQQHRYFIIKYWLCFGKGIE